MSEQPPKVNQPDTPNDQPVDVAALLEKFNDAHQQQPGDVADKVEAAEEAIANNPAPDEATSISDQTEAAWAQHEEPEADSGEENLETEPPLKEQWAQYLFQQRGLRQLNRVVDGKEQKIRAHGGTEEDFKRQLWSHYRDALEELGVITAEDKDTFTPMFTKGVVEGARQLDRDFNERKKMVASALADNPELLQQVDQAIEADKEGYRKDHKGSIRDWDKRIAAASEMSPLLTQLAGQSDYDAHLAPSDFTHMLRQAHEIADKQQPQPTGKTGSKSNVPVESGASTNTNEGEKQDDTLRKEQIAKAAEVFVAKPTLYRPMHRQKLGEARYKFNQKLLETLDDSNMPATEVNQLLDEKWRDEGARVATAGVLQEMGLLEGVNLEGLSDKELRQISNDFWHARARNLKQKSQGTKPEDGAGDLPKVDLSGLEPEKLTIAQQEERWMGLVQQHSVSNGDRGLKQQVDEAYNALQEMRSSPETLAELRQELSELSQQYGKQFDKNSPEARELVRAATAKYNEIQALEQWQATNAEPARAGNLPHVEFPNDPLDPDGAGRLPRVEFPDDPLMTEQTELKRQLDGIENQGSAEAVAIQQRLAEIYRQRLGLPPKEDEPKPLIDTESLKEQVRQQKEAELRAELGNTEYSARYQAALSEYAELKAQSEIKGNGRFSWGRRKREVVLLAASEKLAKAKAALEAQFIKSKEAAGMYDVSAEQLAQAKSDDLFNAMRTLDIEQRQATNDVLDTRAEKRNWLQKAAMRFAAMLDKGDKWPARLKAGGAGFGVGLLSTGLSWAGLWPVSIAVSAGITAGVRQAGIMVQRDKIHAAENKDAQGNARTIVNDEKFAELKKRAVEAGKDGFDAASQLAGDILEGARKIGYDQADRARTNNRRMAVAFGLGAAAGNAVGNLVKVAWGNGAPTHGGDGAGNDQIGRKGKLVPADPNGGSGDHEILKGTQFNVEKGHGLIRELREFATANGHALSPIQAESLHHDLIKEFGKDYIDIQGTKSDIYMHGGDVRLSEPGKANWEDGVPEFIKQWMDRKGLWK